MSNEEEILAELIPKYTIQKRVKKEANWKPARLMLSNRRHIIAPEKNKKIQIKLNEITKTHTSKVPKHMQDYIKNMFWIVFQKNKKKD
ncbi:MAG: Chemotaxis system protein containing CheF-like and HTH domain, archaellum-associated [Candidatus Methanohalarchaeum thermophilum]|uniref:Chemotaxis system protein containing CheF-like and HTH domain, archaellum-associated n=1 Tax=Methanohalarchaeum thermophilum TaxID=1903181 RepID=A0A1Q6DT27_METT1|nr:MAG: Chemotaxis system protein containing CheF-like and HTH domain, archaellum-associated [Candidatus Methanohalarchaeum thermophilum]